MNPNNFVKLTSHGRVRCQMYALDDLYYNGQCKREATSVYTGAGGRTSVCECCSGWLPTIVGALDKLTEEDIENFKNGI